jgi:hypothetical protein
MIVLILAFRKRCSELQNMYLIILSNFLTIRYAKAKLGNDQKCIKHAVTRRRPAV